MATRGWNGTLCHIVKDVTGGDYNFLLGNCGREFLLYSKRESSRQLDKMLELAEEKDVYLQWFDYHIEG